MPFVIVVLLTIILGLASTRNASADHNVILPGLPTSAINEMKAVRTIKYCVNSAGVQYPGFSVQVDKVLAEYTKRLGVTFTRVSHGSMSSTGCQYQLNMQEFSCNGCAAHIYYANWPVISEYKPSLGYTSWESAISHETGHLFGLHERYRDSSGAIGCGGPEAGLTTMDCGYPYIAIPMPLDISRICTMTLVTSWCAAAPEPIYPIWTGSCWFFGYWCYGPAQNEWFDPQGVSEWQPWVNGQVFNRRTGEFYWEYSSWYHWNGSFWECLDRCM